MRRHKKPAAVPFGRVLRLAGIARCALLLDPYSFVHTRRQSASQIGEAVSKDEILLKVAHLVQTGTIRAQQTAVNNHVAAGLS